MSAASAKQKTPTLTDRVEPLEKNQEIMLDTVEKMQEGQEALRKDIDKLLTVFARSNTVEGNIEQTVKAELPGLNEPLEINYSQNEIDTSRKPLGWHEEMAFMAEKVKVRVGSSNGKVKYEVFEVGVNGELMHFLPNTEYVVPRKFIESMIRTRSVEVREEPNPKYVDGSGQNKSRYIEEITEGINFVVIDDTAKGISWFNDLRNQPT